MSATIGQVVSVEALEEWYRAARSDYAAMDEEEVPAEETASLAAATRWERLARRFALVALTADLYDDADIDRPAALARIGVWAKTSAHLSRKRAAAFETRAENIRQGDYDEEDR